MTEIRWKQLAGKWSLVLASLLLFFTLFEITLRLVIPEQPPGTTWGRSVSKNSDGFRDREYVRPKPKGMHRVLVLGDSFTWGVGLDIEESLPKVLERSLQEKFGRNRVEVINAAVPGHNTVEELDLLKARGLSYEPDVILVVYNLNDIEYLPAFDPISGSNTLAVEIVEIDAGEDLTRYSRNQGFRGFILALERRSLAVRFLVPRVGRVFRQLGFIDSPEFSWVEKVYQGFSDENPGWRESKRGLEEIFEVAKGVGAEMIVAIYPLFADLENYGGRHAHRAVADHCGALGVETVDLLPIFEGTSTRSHWINFMDSHPNAAAHRQAAEFLLPVFLEKLGFATKY